MVPGLDRADGEQRSGHQQGHGEQAGNGSDIEGHGGYLLGAC